MTKTAPQIAQRPRDSRFRQKFRVMKRDRDRWRRDALANNAPALERRNILVQPIHLGQETHVNPDPAGQIHLGPAGQIIPGPAPPTNPGPEYRIPPLPAHFDNIGQPGNTPTIQRVNLLGLHNDINDLGFRIDQVINNCNVNAQNVTIRFNNQDAVSGGLGFQVNQIAAMVINHGQVIDTLVPQQEVHGVIARAEAHDIAIGALTQSNVARDNRINNLSNNLINHINQQDLLITRLNARLTGITREMLYARDVRLGHGRRMRAVEEELQRLARRARPVSPFDLHGPDPGGPPDGAPNGPGGHNSDSNHSNGDSELSGDTIIEGQEQHHPVAGDPVADIGPASPGYQPTVDGDNGSPRSIRPTSPATYVPTSPAGYSPTSPPVNRATSPPDDGEPSLPHSPASPYLNPRVHRGNGRSSPLYTPTNPDFEALFGRGRERSSPLYTPTSPDLDALTGRGKRRSSPLYTPTNPGIHTQIRGPRFRAESPNYRPTSPAREASPGPSYYTPTSPALEASPGPINYTPTSPALEASPGSTNYTPNSPAFEAASSSADYAPTSPFDPDVPFSPPDYTHTGLPVGGTSVNQTQSPRALEPAATFRPSPERTRQGRPGSDSASGGSSPWDGIHHATPDSPQYR